MRRPEVGAIPCCLFHGSNDIAGERTLAGQMNFILDKLIAEKKAEPMIVAMPYGHAVPFGSPRERQARNTQLFEKHLFEDVIPMVGVEVSRQAESRSTCHCRAFDRLAAP